MRCVLIALFALASAWPQANPWNYVPADAPSIVAFEWRKVLDSPQRELVRREIPPAALQSMSGINFIEGIDRVIVVQTENSTLLILNGKFEPGRLRDMALSDGGSVKPYKNAELLVASSSQEGGTQIALIGEEIVLLGDRETLVASLDRAGSGKRAANAGQQYDLWLQEKPSAPNIVSVEFALRLKDGVQMTATVHTRSAEAAQTVASNALPLGLNINALGNDVRLSALFQPAQFEQRAGQWRTSIEQLALAKAEKLPEAPVTASVPEPRDGPRRVKIVGLEDGEREVDLIPTALPEDIALTKADMEAETAWLASIGVKGNPLLEHPYATPLTTRSFIVPRSWYRPPADGVSADLMRKDLPVLRTLMESSYAGWETAEKRGWKWAEWFADWDRSLAGRAGQTITWSDALAPFQKLLEVQLDNQIGPLLDSVRWASGSQTAILEQAPAGGCSQIKLADGRVVPIDANDPAQQPQRALLGDLETLAAYISYPRRLGEVTAVACGGKWIDVKSASNAPAVPIKTDKRIVDLRGGSAEVKPVDYTTRARQSCLTAALQWGATQQPTQQQLDELMNSSSCSTSTVDHKADWDYRHHQFSGKALTLVLVDATCAGECERTVYALAHSPGTVIAGVNTFGASQFIQPGHFVLPHTRLPFRMALEQTDFYGDQRSFDGRGFNVDILLPTAQSQSAEAIARLAERLLR